MSGTVQEKKMLPPRPDEMFRDIRNRFILIHDQLVERKFRAVFLHDQENRRQTLQQFDQFPVIIHIHQITENHAVHPAVHKVPYGMTDNRRIGKTVHHLAGIMMLHQTARNIADLPDGRVRRAKRPKQPDGLRRTAPETARQQIRAVPDLLRRFQNPHPRLFRHRSFAAESPCHGHCTDIRKFRNLIDICIFFRNRHFDVILNMLSITLYTKKRILQGAKQEKNNFFYIFP